MIVLIGWVNIQDNKILYVVHDTEEEAKKWAAVRGLKNVTQKQIEIEL